MHMPKDVGPAASASRPLHVVVVDPDAQSRLWLGALLSRGCGMHGATVVECDGSADALEAVLGSPPCDLLITELDLAQGDGIELLRGLARGGYDGAVMLGSACDGRTLAAAARLARTHGLRLLCAARKPVLPAKVRKVLASCGTGTVPESKAACVWGGDDLDRAFATRQFVNFYQPQVEIESGRVTGFELLVRWAHPVHGLLTAEDFIDEVEATGRADDLLLATLPAALRDASPWQRHGRTVSLAINVSPLTLRNLAFPELVEAEAAAAGFPLERLAVEVTDGLPLDEPRTQFDTLLRLHLKHVTLSMDDFGKGHASIDSLRRLPFGEIKLDRCLVHGARRDPSLRAVMEASLGTAKRLGLRVVGEGVETPADADFLRAAGCDIVQGNLIGRPMSATAAQRWFRRRPDLGAGLYHVAGKLHA